ncbi:hypothetical protein QVD17_15493 [Tagetes erecta]|uniref:Bifunctional inhibitor/plant lipid transfer protein/seed storage helical domain-containing protein n=1 Tax=Tagetes erecta TaxID=13708 RepID=A0AAD8NYN9_TARER|nr:hypothetical protein QVD17_15493 [Tagetes erecta]
MISTYRTATIIENNEHEILKDTLDNPRASQNECPKIPEHRTFCHELLMPGLIKHREECCTELKNMKKECVCDGIQQTLEKAKQDFGDDVGYRRTMFNIAKNLPNRCGVEVKECHLTG